MANGREDGEATGADASAVSDREELLVKNRERRAQIRAEEKSAVKRRESGDAEGDEEAAVEDSSDGAVVMPSSKVVMVLSAAVVVLAIAVAVLGYLYATSGSNDDADAQQQAINDAKTYATSVLTYSAGDYADLDKRIREIATPEFADRYIASSQKAREGNDEAKAAGSAEAKEAGLVSLSDTTAVVLVAIDQNVKTPLVPAVGPDGMDYQSRVKITLTRDGDDWKLSDLSVV
ncbi:hypothetical protein [Gordonia sp. (in: high G+C Gram-positive bacteria)]|mgnify:CR=1 FL=1|uniref:hypothetical protein n=1 Tax=Gordonia sp. (in: high G+C Gram-positive bacteria) TaxID=84139 RepID=UPI00169B623C|nr:hypothetical protein [Gordonia sp. (in: high G+C Gram-positive bacteria)]NLG47533.1 hypothetical protein [Gordonia sp. (in: high G+C Gram-positive bacteria)]